MALLSDLLFAVETAVLSARKAPGRVWRSTVGGTGAGLQQSLGASLGCNQHRRHTHEIHMDGRRYRAGNKQQAMAGLDLTACMVSQLLLFKFYRSFHFNHCLFELELKFYPLKSLKEINLNTFHFLTASACLKKWMCETCTAQPSCYQR